MSAVDKSVVSYAGEKRLASDHTRTGVNKATDMSSLSYSLETYKLIAAFLKSGYFMAVSDVDAAYTNLPLAPSIWRFFLFRFAPASSSSAYSANHLYVNLFADFGTAGAPGTFKIFFEDVIMSMARSEQVVSVPTPIYVDDIQFIDESAAVADSEMEALHDFCADIRRGFGGPIPFRKQPKTKHQFSDVLICQLRRPLAALQKTARNETSVF